MGLNSMTYALNISLKNSLKKQLLEAFPRTPIPKEILLSANTFSDDDISESVRKVLHLKSWDEILLNNWLRCTASTTTLMYFITPQAFHYYLPSLLTSVIDDPGYFDWGVSALLPYNKNHVRKNTWWMEYESLFNEPQRQAIMSFLSYVEKESDEMHESKYLAQTAICFWTDAMKDTS
jgi:hypothetical protein